MNTNGNGPDESLSVEEHAEVTIDWLDGYRTGSIEGYVTGFDQGLVRGRSEGYDEAAFRFRILVSEYHDEELLEAFERMVG